MKKIAIVLVSTFLATSLVACSNSASEKQPDYTVKNVNVAITDNFHLIGQTFAKDSSGKKVDVKNKALYYEFKMKQNGDRDIFKKDKDVLEATIIPDPDLKKASKDIVGVDIFKKNHDKYGYGMGMVGFDATKLGKVSVDYEVGATVKNNYIPLAPSDKELKKLAKVARHGTLVLTRDKKEIARYSLEDLKPIEK